MATRSLFLFFFFFLFLFLFPRFFLPLPPFFCTGTRSSFLEASLWATSEVMHDKKALRLRRCTENFNKHREKKVNPVHRGVMHGGGKLTWRGASSWFINNEIYKATSPLAQQRALPFISLAPDFISTLFIYFNCCNLNRSCSLLHLTVY